MKKKFVHIGKLATPLVSKHTLFKLPSINDNAYLIEKDSIVKFDFNRMNFTSYKKNNFNINIDNKFPTYIIDENLYLGKCGSICKSSLWKLQHDFTTRLSKLALGQLLLQCSLCAVLDTCPNLFASRFAQKVTNKRKHKNRSLSTKSCWIVTLSNTQFPIPNAIAPNAPWVEVCESPQATVIPGWVNPNSGAIT